MPPTAQGPVAYTDLQCCVVADAHAASGGLCSGLSTCDRDCYLGLTVGPEVQIVTRLSDLTNG